MKETVIQFGEGGFLRGFADWFLQKLNEQGLYDGKAVIVQPIPTGLCAQLNAQNCRYNLYLRGIENGSVVNDRTEICAVSRCVDPYSDFEAYLRLAENPDARFIISNTTEAGIEYIGTEKITDRPAKSFPAKLTQLLYRRYELKLPGFIILSCELIDNNGAELKKCVLQYAKLWQLGDSFTDWLEAENDFCSTLVDRIVTGYPKEEADALRKEIGWDDRMIDTAEPFHLWVIGGHHEDELPLQKAGFHVIWTDDVTPYKKRKVRILNGAHTSMVLGAYLYGLETVGECMNDPVVRAYLERNLFREILPVIGDTEDNRAFAAAVLERFSNPFIRHLLLSIALNSVSKFDVRVLPTIMEYKEKFGSWPEGLCMSFAALIAFYRTDQANDAPEIVSFMKTASVEEILKKDYWSYDVSGMIPVVEKYTELIEKGGMKAAYEAVLADQ